MLQTLTAPRGMVTAPHHLAAENRIGGDAFIIRRVRGRDREHADIAHIAMP
jgi:hypothetical protein